MSSLELTTAVLTTYKHTGQIYIISGSMAWTYMSTDWVSSMISWVNPDWKVVNISVDWDGLHIKTPYTNAQDPTKCLNSTLDISLSSQLKLHFRFTGNCVSENILAVSKTALTSSI